MVTVGLPSDSSQVRKVWIDMSSSMGQISQNCGKAVPVDLEVVLMQPASALEQ